MSTLKFNQWLNPDNTENYKCRAWVNFNGTGTVAIRAAGNVSSVTDNGVGDYTVNFTNAMPDLNYSTVGNSWYSGVSSSAFATGAPPVSTSSKQVTTQNIGATASIDVNHCTIAFFR
ncbi:hypothetical protein D9M68_823090 [compost metagenome]|uniref:hypothetical protein n=1 Tax=Hydrogenophaga sp. TaxID=1904254 RepID=UPI0028BBF313